MLGLLAAGCSQVHGAESSWLKVPGGSKMQIVNPAKAQAQWENGLT